MNVWGFPLMRPSTSMLSVLLTPLDTRRGDPLTILADCWSLQPALFSFPDFGLVCRNLEPVFAGSSA